MRYFIFLISSLLSFAVLYAQEKISIAVLELDTEGISESEARLISARLRTDLFDTGKFTILERDKVQEILEEQGFQQSGCTTNECIVEMGKLIGVRQMVAGNIGKIGKLITLTIRLIDVETGSIIRIAKEDCECPIESIIKESIPSVASKLAGQEARPSYDKQKEIKEFRQNLLSLGMNHRLNGDLDGNLFSIRYLRRLGGGVAVSLEAGLGNLFKKTGMTSDSISHFFEPLSKNTPEGALKLCYFFLDENSYAARVFIGFAFGSVDYKYYKIYYGEREVLEKNASFNYRMLPLGITFDYYPIKTPKTIGMLLDIGYCFSLNKLQKEYPFEEQIIPESIVIDPGGLYIFGGIGIFF